MLMVCLSTACYGCGAPPQALHALAGSAHWAPGLVVTPRGAGLLLQPAVPTMQTFWVIALPIFMISSFFP